MRYPAYYNIWFCSSSPFFKQGTSTFLFIKLTPLKVLLLFVQTNVCSEVWPAFWWKDYVRTTYNAGSAVCKRSIRGKNLHGNVHFALEARICVFKGNNTDSTCELCFIPSFVLYTNSCRSHHKGQYLLKFSIDTALLFVAGQSILIVRLGWIYCLVQWQFLKT